MKLRTLALVLVWPVVQSQSVWAEPLGTAFTYQGRLHDQGTPANGLYDLRFILYSAEFGGSQVSNVLTNASLSVGNGLFTATLDFGLGPFDGAAYWLEVAVRTNNSAMSFIPLHPRQRLMPTPYALHALNAGFAAEAANASNALTAASVPWSGITGVPAGFSNTTYTAGIGLILSPGNEFSVIFDGSGMSNAAARSDHTHGADDLVSGVLADERLSSNVALLSAPQLFTGSNAFVGVTILTNEANFFAGSFQGNGEGLTNLMATHLVGTLLDSQLSTNIPRLEADQTFLGLNSFNSTSGVPFAVGNSGTVSNLSADLLDGLDSASFWRTGGNTGTVAGANFLGTTDNQPLELWVNGQRALRLEPNTNGSPNLIGGASVNSVGAGIVGATIAGGGSLHHPLSDFTAASNTINASFGVVGGGFNNAIQRQAHWSTISGGFDNTIEQYASAATVAGGYFNTIKFLANESTISGGMANVIQTNADQSTISGGAHNVIRARSSTICGGQINLVQKESYYSTIAGGEGNLAAALFAAIGGGQLNSVTGPFGTVPGGLYNVATNYCFAAGQRAKAVNTGSFIWADSTDADFASTSSNQFLVRASGGVGIGTTAPQTALHVGSERQTFVTIESGPGQESGIALRTNGVAKWYLYADDTNAADFQIIATGLAGEGEDSPRLRLPDENKNVLLALSGGRVGIGTNGPASALDVVGEVRATMFTPVSDRAAKEHFEPADQQAVLEKVAKLSIETWSFKGQPDARHIGPMAQDFRAAFGLGADDKHISTVDADGVALAAIQGLNQKLEEMVKRQAAQIETLKQGLAELTELTKRLTARAGLLGAEGPKGAAESP